MPAGGELAHRVAIEISDIKIARQIEGQRRGIIDAAAGKNAEISARGSKFVDGVIADVGDVKIPRSVEGQPFAMLHTAAGEGGHIRSAVGNSHRGADIVTAHIETVRPGGRG